MKPDLYTKAVLTVIALMLTVTACNQLVKPAATANAQSAQFAGVLFSKTNGVVTFFDTRTGEVWKYDEDGPVMSELKLTALGKPLLPLK